MPERGEAVRAAGQQEAADGRPRDGAGRADVRGELPGLLRQRDLDERDLPVLGAGGEEAPVRGERDGGHRRVGADEDDGLLVLALPDADAAVRAAAREERAVRQAIFLLSTTGLGLFVSATSATQQQAMIVNMFITNVMIVLSGFLFPIENMPPVAQWISSMIPVRYFLVIVRSIFLKGAGFEILWPDVWPMALFGVTIMTLSVIRFHKRVG